MTDGSSHRLKVTTTTTIKAYNLCHIKSSWEEDLAHWLVNPFSVAIIFKYCRAFRAASTWESWTVAPCPWTTDTGKVCRRRRHWNRPQVERSTKYYLSKLDYFSQFYLYLKIQFWKDVFERIRSAIGEAHGLLFQSCQEGSVPHFDFAAFQLARIHVTHVLGRKYPSHPKYQ